MKLAGIMLLLTGCLSGQRGHAQAGERPRQLGGPPTASPVTADSMTRVSVGSGLPAPADLTHSYQVGLKTGSVLRATHVAAHYPVIGPAYLLVDGQQRVALTEVGFYENETGSYRRARPRGHFRELTLRQVLPGRVQVYQPRTSFYRQLALSSALLAMGNPLAAATSAAVPLPRRGYFAKDDGPVYALTHGHLRRALRDSPAALTLEARAHRAEVINTASAVLGMGLFVGGLVRSIGHLGGSNLNGDLTLGMLGASVPLLVAPLVLKNKPAQHRRQAIELYNYAQRR